MKTSLRVLLTLTCVIGVISAGAIWFRGPLQRTQRWNQITEIRHPEIRLSAQQLDRVFEDWAAQQNVSLATQTDWLNVCRRISLGLVGSSMSLEEIRQLEQFPESERIEIYTNYLLMDSRWSDNFSERLARAFVGTDQGPFLLFRRRKFREWLAEQLEKDVRFDVIAKTLLEAEGLTTDKPEVNFVTAQIPPEGARQADVVRLAGRTSRVFLGMRMDCLECHNDFVDKIYFPTENGTISGEQKHFHQLAAFFSGTTVAENVFLGVRDEASDYRFKFLGQKTEEIVPAAVPFSPHLLPTAGKLRPRLAAWITHPQNPAFSRAIVNRIWALVTGRPLHEPVDDIPLDRPVAPPLQWLADDFAQHNFDVKRLLRLITSSTAFQRSSSVGEGEIIQEQLDCWAVYPLTQLRPEQVAGSVIQASQLKTVDRDSVWLTQLVRFGQMNDFLKAYGDRGEDELSPENETIPQRLLLLNGSMIRERTNPEPLAIPIARVANQASSDSQCLEVCFLSILNRRPTATELNHFVAKLEGQRGDQRVRVVSEVSWILMNSTEFLWNH
jgi:hypothetical protein